MLVWPDLTLPPINLWSYPWQRVTMAFIPSSDPFGKKVFHFNPHLRSEKFQGHLHFIEGLKAAEELLFGAPIEHRVDTDYEAGTITVSWWLKGHHT